MCNSQELNSANEEDEYLWRGLALAVGAGNEDSIRDVIIDIDSLTSENS